MLTAIGQRSASFSLVLRLALLRGAETVESLYASLDEALQKRLGKPKAVQKSKSGPPQKEYKLNGDTIVALNERPSGDRRVVYVEIAQPQQTD